MKIGWRGALGILLSVALLWWTLHDQDLGEIWHVLSQSSIPLWIGCMVFATAIFPLRARRWAALLEPAAGRLPFRSLWESTAIGMMATNVIPARMGEVARPFALSRAEPRVRFTTAFASIVVDRLFDGTVVLLLMIVATLDPAFPADGAPGAHAIALSMKGVGAFLAAVLVVLALIVHSPARVFAIYDAIAGRLAPRIAPTGRRLLEHFASGLGMLRSPRLVAEVFFWTLLHWLCNAFAFWLGFRAIGITVPATAALLLQGIIAISVALPSAPGFFGLFEAAGKVGLGLYGVSEPQAVTWAIGFHLLSYIPITVMGAWYLTRMKLHLRDLTNASGESAGDVTNAGGAPPA